MAPYAKPFVSQLRAAALAVGQELIILDVNSDREIENAFTTLVERGAGALIWGPGAGLFPLRERVVALTARHRIPAMYVLRLSPHGYDLGEPFGRSVTLHNSRRHDRDILWISRASRRSFLASTPRARAN